MIEDIWKFKEVKTENNDEHLFWALTEFTFRGELRDKMSSYNELLEYTKKLLGVKIKSECDSRGEDCNFMILGMLGSFGISVLWFCNQYTFILETVDRIKSKSVFCNEQMYLTAHTIFSRNPMYDNIDPGHELLCKLQGKALVQITLKKWINAQLDIIWEKEYLNKMHTSGEYDISFEMEARDVFVNFEREQIFNHDSDVYQNCILQTRVTLAREIQESDKESDKERDSSSEEKIIESEKYLVQVKESYEALRGELKKSLDKTAGMVDTLDSLLCDYRYNVTSAVNQNWEADFSYIFLKNIECIRLMMNYSGKELLEPIRFIFNNLKQQIFHISEANSLNFELPKCHLRYTGQEDNILFAYMGIIKEILKTAYELESYNKQSEIIPIVAVDAVPIIESDLYFDISKFAKKTDTDQDFKILSLNLPHVTFYDVPMYFQYLFHEVYHYVVPKDREYRDYILGILLSAILFNETLKHEIEKLFHFDIKKLKLIFNFMNPLIYYIAVDNYTNIHKSITGFHENMAKKETDRVILIKDIYTNALVDYLIKTENIFGEWADCLGQHLCAGDFYGISFDAMQSFFNKNKKQIDVEVLQKWFEKRENLSIKENYINGTKELIDKILEGLEEISADIPMIELSKMPLTDYLILYSHSMKNELLTPKNLFDNDEELKELVRIGIIIDFYERREERLSDVKENFIYSYIAKYISFFDESPLEIKSKLFERRREAEDWFEFFSKSWEKYKEQFGMFQIHFHMIAEMSCVKNRVRNYDINEKCSFYFQKYRECYNEFSKKVREIEGLYLEGVEPEKIIALCVKAESHLNEAVFEENIKLINHFQTQERLEKLHAENERLNLQKEENYEIYEFPEFPKEFEMENLEVNLALKLEPLDLVYDLKHFLEIIDEVSKKIEESCERVFHKKNYELWYRGQNNSAHGLLPGIMRKYVSQRREFHYLSQYQRYLFEEFRFRVDGAPEVMDKFNYGIPDYLALMQHYEVNTNFLDWSEDAFTGLYFALEPLITQAKSSADTAAAIFVFSPHLYNEARSYMIEKSTLKTPCTESVYLASSKTSNGSDGLIPNISANHNDEMYDMFLLGNLDYESKNRYGYTRTVALEGKEEMAFLPLAIHTSRLNPRIRSQSGIFLAYNLYAEPSKAVDSYNYMDLEKVQEYYFKNYDEKQKERFLYKVVIEKEAAKDIARCLRRMGISKERIYPELANIGKRVR